MIIKTERRSAISVEITGFSLLVLNCPCEHPHHITDARRDQLEAMPEFTEVLSDLGRWKSPTLFLELHHVTATEAAQKASKLGWEAVS